MPPILIVSGRLMIRPVTPPSDEANNSENGRAAENVVCRGKEIRFFRSPDDPPDNSPGAQANEHSCYGLRFLDDLYVIDAHDIGADVTAASGKEQE